MTQKKTSKARARRFMLMTGFKLIKAVEWMIRRNSLVGDHPFFDTNDFPWTANLEANWQVIRSELDVILRHRDALPSFQDISTDQVSLTTDDKWKTYFLYGYGYKSEKNCARCPDTTKLIEQVPGMMTAFFSILAPGKHIPPHRGPYKGLLRYHLGLQVPEPKQACRIRVADEVAHWEEGQGMLFDDTFNHQVWNDTDGQRVVLFMDVLRPLPSPVAWFNKVVIKAVAVSPFIQDARKNQEVWEQRLDDVVALS